MRTPKNNQDHPKPAWNYRKQLATLITSSELLKPNQWKTPKTIQENHLNEF